MKSPFTLLCAVPLAVSMYAFWKFILTHLGDPGFGTGLWGVPSHSTAPDVFAPYWAGLAALGLVLAVAATYRGEQLKNVAWIALALHAYPVAYEIWALMKGPY
jgi:hypothetical protein